MNGIISYLGSNVPYDASSNSHANILVQNIRWMMEAIEEFGNYPLGNN